MLKKGYAKGVIDNAFSVRNITNIGRIFTGKCDWGGRKLDKIMK